MKLRYVYHIYYMTEGNVYGDCSIYRINPIDTEYEVESVRKFISEEYCNNKKVVLCNFTLLNKRGR